MRGVVAKAIVDLLTAYREGWGIEFTALAPSTVYGPRQRSDAGVVAAMVAAAAGGAAPRITGDGRQTRDFVYVDDVVDALVRSGQRGSGLVVNVGTGVQTSLRDLWALVAPDGGPPTYVAAGPDELVRFAVSPGAGAHPPRLVAMDDAGRGPRRPALTASGASRCRLGVRRDLRSPRRSGGPDPRLRPELRDAASVDRASSAATSGVDITDGTTTARIPAASTSAASSASTGSMTSAAATGA